MKSRYIFTALIFINCFKSYAITQVPDSCFEKKITPCLVKSDEDFVLSNPNELSITLEKNSLIKINERMGSHTSIKDKSVKVEILKGQVVLTNNTTSLFYLNSVNIGSKDTYYIKKNKLDVDVYKAITAEFIQISKNDDVDLIESKNLMTKKEVSNYIAQFSNVSSADSKIILSQFDVKLQENVHSQAKILQRKVAAEESALKIDAEARQKQLQENKMLKQQFFMRTFQQ